MKSIKKIIAVIGPTASGKTSLAIKLSKRFNGELINTDSRQIYKFMDIGTAKGEVSKVRNSKLELPNKYKTRNPNIARLDIYKLEGAIIHLINVVEPDEVLTLAQYQKLAYAVIEDILSRGKLPILVGGTGLYIDAITKGYKMPKVAPNEDLRKELNTETIKQLQKRIKKINKERYESLNNSDQNNPRRLIRLIEIETKLTTDGSQPTASKPIFNVLYLTPKRSREKLYDRINKRAEIIIKSGLIDEVKSLIKKGFKFSKPAMTAISYPIVRDYIDKKISKEELVDKFRQGDRNYARRQLTWFKRYPVIKVKNEEKAFVEVIKYIKR